MKIIDKLQPWPHKINFIDGNNVVVGYDLSQDCCERAGWYISVNKRIDINDEESLGQEAVEGYVFDPLYFDEVKNSDSLDCGEMVRFRLVRKDSPDLFLHLFNVHNGYYAHGFTMNINDKTMKEGYL